MRKMPVVVVAVLVLASCKREAVWLENDHVYNHTPITLEWDEAELGVYGDSIKWAMRTINERVDCAGKPLLIAAATPGTADIRIRFDNGAVCGGQTADVPHAPASTYFCYDGPVIVLRRLDDIRVAGRIMLHEIGHGLYLAHDDTGMMAPQVHEGDLGYPDHLLPSKTDVAALHARYCP